MDYDLPLFRFAHAVHSDVTLTLLFFNNCRLTTVRLVQLKSKHFELVDRCLNPRLRLFFWVQKFRISIFFCFFRKMNIFWGYEDFVDIFLGSLKNWASLRVISMHFRVLF